MSDFAVFTPEALAAHDAVVERDVRIGLAKTIESIPRGDDLLGHLLRLDTAMAEGAKMALEVAAEVILDSPVVVLSDAEERDKGQADNR